MSSTSSVIAIAITPSLNASSRPGSSTTAVWSTDLRCGRVGAIAPDGSPVDLYRRLSGAREAAMIVAAVPPPATLLELGCGAGRVTNELTARGYDVTAVDNEPEMLRHVRDATAVLADIAVLRLEQRFDAVLLCSHFVNAPDAVDRHALL